MTHKKKNLEKHCLQKSVGVLGLILVKHMMKKYHTVVQYSMCLKGSSSCSMMPKICSKANH